MVLWQLASDGTITGANPADGREKFTAALLGVQWDYSKAMGGLGAAMRLVASLKETTDSLWDNTGKFTDDELLSISGKFTAAFTQAVFAEGIIHDATEWLDALSGKKPENGEQVILKALGYGVYGMVPYLTMARQASAMTDHYRRNTYGLLDELKALVPVVREDLAPKTDRWGQPIARGAKPVHTDPVDMALDFLGIAGNIYTPTKAWGVDLDREDGDKLRSAIGQKQYELLQPVVESGGFRDNMDTPQGNAVNVKTIKTLLSVGKKIAVAETLPELLPNYTNERMRAVLAAALGEDMPANTDSEISDELDEQFPGTHKASP